MTTQQEALRLAEVAPYLEGGERGQWIMSANSWNPSEERALALAVARQFQVYFGDEPDFELFYLFLAEFLADEGM